MKQVKIAGVGNVLLGDDGIGPYTVCLLESEYEFEANVQVEDWGTPGLNLIVQVMDSNVLILIDSVANGAAPGTVTLYRKEDILRAAPRTPRIDPHSPTLAESLMIANWTAQRAPEILLIGITGQDCEANHPISAAARDGARQAIQQILGELTGLDIPYRKRSEPMPMEIWWEPLPCAGSGLSEQFDLLARCSAK